MFNGLTDAMRGEALKVLQRIKDADKKVVDLSPVKVAFLVDPDQKYTVCLLRANDKLTAGVAKRATYSGMADDYSEETGRSIAFSRAIRNLALGIESAFVTL